MDKKAAEQEIRTLREQIQYHNQKYYTEDAPEISDFAYDQLYRRLEELEAAPGMTKPAARRVYGHFHPEGGEADSLEKPGNEGEFSGNG